MKFRASRPKLRILRDEWASAGFTSVLPVLFGKPGVPKTWATHLAKSCGVCISSEFACFATKRSSPITDWLRALCRQVHAECGGPGVGAIGMCLTGGFALALMVEPSVMAPVLSQPSLPFPVTQRGVRRLVSRIRNWR